VTERRLIEEFLPVAAVGAAALSEKIGGRKGHLSTLHLWWARRPLAAARAAVYGALVPAPEEVDADRQSRFFEALCAWGGPESSIRAARDEIRSHHEAPPRVLDPFSGGGAIPLEASRLGCDVVALELNPVAHVIELCTLDYPQRFGPSLADDVREWGRWLIDRARAELADLYPAPTGTETQGTLEGGSESAAPIPIAYFWTRTVPCPNPAERPHVVPLVRQTWLRKKPGDYVALRPVADRRTLTVGYEAVRSPTVEGLGFDPSGLSERGSTTCILCGASVDLEWIKSQGRSGNLSNRVMGAGLVTSGLRGKSYVGSSEALRLVPAAGRVDAVVAKAEDAGVRPPTEELPSADTRSFFTPPYGLTRYVDLFSRRQLAMLMTLCRLARDAHDAMIEQGVDGERARAIATYLGLLIDRVADRSSTLCRWDNSSRAEKTANTFGRQALPMTWDYSESNPFGGASGDIGGQLEYVTAVIEHCARTGTAAEVIRGSATDLPLADSSVDAVITDPPYYDNISYADLSDFFYVWLRQSIGHLHPEHFGSPLTPKRSEAIASPYRHDGDKRAAKQAYEDMMSAAFAECRRVLKPDGVMVCVYAHQTTAGWATLVEAVRRAGFIVTEAWPLDTEMSTRGIAQGTAALASSIFLVARPRSAAEIGDWAHDVRPELQRVVSERVADLSGLGITGTDLVIAAIGAGMRPYTLFAKVEKPNGEELAPSEFLDEVQREVAEAILARIFETDRRGLGRVDQATQFYVIGRFEFADALAPWDDLNTLARGTGIELTAHVNGNAALVEKSGSKARLRDYAERGEAIELGRSTIDHLHRVLWLADHHPERVKDYLEMGRPDPERLRLVAHALSRPGLDTTGQRGAEAEACERLLGSWRRLVEDNLFTTGSA
jgi:putative DNA methylase